MDGHQLSQKMNLIVPMNWDSSFTTYRDKAWSPNILGYPSTYPSKTNNFLGTHSKAFSSSTNIKELLSFGPEFFTVSLNKHSINSPSPWLKPTYIAFYQYLAPTNAHPKSYTVWKHVQTTLFPYKSLDLVLTNSLSVPPVTYLWTRYH